MYFIKAIPVFAREYIDKINISLLFIEDFDKQENLSLTIAGESEYQIFLNGRLIGYGPAKAAHNYHRVDNYPLNNLKEHNRLVILLASYRTNTFDRVNQSPFICYEIKNGNSVIAHSNTHSSAYLYEPRIQKVTRFSYQRAFSESYNEKYDDKLFLFKQEMPFKKVQLIENRYGQFINRTVNYPKLDEQQFLLKKKDRFEIDSSIKPYEDRYMFNEGLVIFSKNEWEVDPNQVVSQIVLKEKLPLDNVIEQNQSLAFISPISITGFIKADIEVLEPSSIYIYFDEIVDENAIDFKFYRNTTHNIISYQLNRGVYQLLSFMPYTAKYVRISNLNGKAKINNLSIVLLENPDSHNIQYSFDNEKLQLIFDAARNTFASNAVDILTDCPSRERAGWLCDSYFTGRSEKLFTGYNLVERAFLENYALYQYHGDVTKGMLPMCYPADFSKNEIYIPNWAMFYGVELHSYLSRNDDPKLKKQSEDNLKELIKFFKKYENEYGLLENLESWVFVEWSHANDEESIKGVNIPSNALYASFLKCSGEILHNQSLIEQSNKIKQTIKKLAYNGEFFVDNLLRNEKGQLIQNNRIGETTLYYLFYFEVITKEEYPELFDIMVNSFGPNRDLEKVYPNIYKANVFIGDYLRLEILLRHHLYQKALDETVDYFYKMAKTSGTLWEHDSPHASLDHGFASFAANIIFEALTGIYQIDYINKKIYVRNTYNDERFDITVPLGDSKIAIKKEKTILFEIEKGYQIIK